MKRVLVIEDDDLLGRMYKKLLERAGYNVELQTDGKGALLMINSVKFDLVLLDIMLGGGVNGFDVLEVAKKNPVFTGTKVIIATNLESEEKVAKEIGADGYFAKTAVKPEGVVAKIAELIGK